LISLVDGDALFWRFVDLFSTMHVNVVSPTL